MAAVEPVAFAVQAVIDAAAPPIETPVGKFSTVVLRYAEEEDTGDTVLWCAGELGYLPVRIRANDEGKEVLVAKLTALTGSPAD